MKPQHIARKLRRISLELAEIGAEIPKSLDDDFDYVERPSVLMENAVNSVSQLATNLAVTEAVQAGYTQFGGKGNADAYVIRGRAVQVAI